MLWRYKLDGYYFWAVNWWRKDPWTTISSKEDSFKRGTLIYPSPLTGMPLPSLRLEAFRDGIEDMLMLKILDRKTSGSAHILRGKLIDIPESFRKRFEEAPPDLSVWHNELLKAIEGL
jgi:hypothetical protein